MSVERRGVEGDLSIGDGNDPGDPGDPDDLGMVFGRNAPRTVLWRKGYPDHQSVNMIPTPCQEDFHVHTLSGSSSRGECHEHFSVKRAYGQRLSSRRIFGFRARS